METLTDSLKEFGDSTDALRESVKTSLMILKDMSSLFITHRWNLTAKEAEQEPYYWPGSNRVAFKEECSVGDTYLLNGTYSNAANGNYPLVFFTDENEDVLSDGMILATTVEAKYDVEVVAPPKAKYVYVQFSNANTYSLKKYVYGSFSDVSEKIIQLDEIKDNGFSFLVASDLHYYKDENPYDGLSADERIQLFVDNVLAKYAEKEIKFALMVGDIVSSHGEDDSYPKDFIEKFSYQLPFPVFYIVGNHDVYTNDKWMQYFGHKRQFTFETDDFFFICLDVYSTSEPQGGSGTATRYYNYGGVDNVYLDTQLEIAKNSGKKIIVAAHTVDTEMDSDFYSKIINAGAIAYICGHSHVAVNGTRNGIFTINAGWFALRDAFYSGNTTPWGFNIVDIKEGKLQSTHIIVAHDYVDSGLGAIPYSEETSIIGTIDKKQCADFNAYTFNRNIAIANKIKTTDII